MRFADPAFLFLFLLLPVLAWYDIAWGRRARARLRFSSLDLIPGAGPRTWDAERLLSVLRLLGAALLIAALARPQSGRERQEVTTPVTDILLCVDTSSSMEALDFKPKNRLQAAVEVMREFIRSRPHDRLGLVVFSGMAFTQCPLTTDHGALLGFLDHVRIGMIESDGTAIGTAIAACAARLKNSVAKSKAAVLLTDGRSNAGEVDPVTAAKAAAALGVKIYAIGMGAPGGAVYPVSDPFFGTRYVRLPEDLDEGSLREVAAATGGRYFRATDLKGLKEIYAEIDRLEKTEIKTETFADYRDAYLPLLLAGLFLFLTEIALAQTVWRRVP